MTRRSIQTSSITVTIFAYQTGMGDVKLTPRQTAAILTKLDDGVRSVADAREQVIQAMADRRAERPEPAKREPSRIKRKNRQAAR